MSTIDILLPASLRNYLESQITSRGYRDASEFVASLLEADRQRQSDLEIEKLLGEAVDGPFSDWTSDDVDEIRRLGTAVINRRKLA